MDGATYAVRLRDLEANVDELKDRIRRSHTRLALLSDTIITGGVGGSRAEISVDNEMSSAFRLVKALVVLDGAVQYNRADESGALPSSAARFRRGITPFRSSLAFRGTATASSATSAPTTGTSSHRTASPPSRGRRSRSWPPRLRRGA
jgi:hypothetical protein